MRQGVKMNRLELAHDYAKIILQKEQNVHTENYKEIAKRAVAMADALIMELDFIEEQNQKLILTSTSIQDIELTSRLKSDLIAHNIHTVGDLIGYSEADLLKLPNIAKNRVSEIKKYLSDNQLELWEPDWGKAPVWANWWCIEKSGEAFWFFEKPVKSLSDGWTLGGSSDLNIEAPTFSYKGDWLGSLRSRDTQ